MKFQYFCIPALLSAGLFASCVDDKYDLSDIDTTVRVDVNDLTIPLNLDEILLSDIIEEGDRIKVVNGEYAVTQDGRFTSTAVLIDDFTIHARELPSTHLTMPFIPAAAGLAEAGHFDINPNANSFEFSSSNIPEEITAITDIQGVLEFNFSFLLKGITSVARKVQLSDVMLQLPAGLSLTETAGGSYDTATGLMSMPSITITDESYSFRIVANKVNFEILDAKLNTATHSIDVKGDFYVKSGKVIVNRADLIGSAPTDLDLSINYSIPDFPLTAFSGRVKYDITGVEISDVDLSDLPDVLSQPGTDITLANPQIYLQVTNPLQPYSLYAQTGLTIKANHGSVSTPYSIDNKSFTIGNNHTDGLYNFCLAPTDPQNKPSDYAGAEFVPFSDLGKVLSGDGMPQSLSITLDNPCLPDQPVKDLRLGVELGDVTGHYDFIAPIALAEGSKIVYSDILDGWDTEEMEYLTITSLHIKATITSEVPLSIDFKAYPVDDQHHQINNVEIKGAQINATSNPQDVDIYITGTIRDLAGVQFEATAIAAEGEKVLRPGMTIKVSQLRPTVTGYYEKEL